MSPILNKLTSPGQQNQCRNKIWEINDRFHCTVIGTCLDLGELRRLGRKMSIEKTVLADDYQLHITFVGIIRKRSGEAKLVNKLLDRKYKATIQAFSTARDTKALDKLWIQYLAKGEVSPALWALVTHPYTSESLRFKVYGKVHMLSHLSGASVRVDMQQLISLRRRVPELEQALSQAQRDTQHALAVKNNIIQTLNNKVYDLQKKLQASDNLKQKIKTLEEGTLVAHLHTQVESYAAKLAINRIKAERAESNLQQSDIEILELKSTHQKLQSIVLQNTAERDAVEANLERLLEPDCEGCQNSDNCIAESDLKNRNILYVGGRNRQCTYFRALVERRNGQFIHHDGGLEESKKRLGSLLCRADAVLCPLDCISHDAVGRIKRDCKRYGKPLKFLPQASLASFTQGLNELEMG